MAETLRENSDDKKGLFVDLDSGHLDLACSFNTRELSLSTRGRAPQLAGKAIVNHISSAYLPSIRNMPSGFAFRGTSPVMPGHMALSPCMWMAILYWLFPASVIHSLSKLEQETTTATDWPRGIPESQPWKSVSDNASA